MKNKQSLIGYLLMALIFVSFFIYNNQQQKKYSAQKAIADSIAAAAVPTPIQNPISSKDDSLSLRATPEATGDSSHQVRLALLSSSTEGTEEFYFVENDVMKIAFSNKGGRVASVELKDYVKYKGAPLILFEQSSSQFDLSFFIKRGFNTQQIFTSEYYFTPTDPTDVTFAQGEGEKKFSLRLAIDSSAYVEYIYTVNKVDYMIDMDVRLVGMKELLAPNQGDLELKWKMVSFQNEKGFNNENNYTTLAYCYPGEKSIEQLSFSKESESEEIATKIKWVGFKQQFFSSVLIAKDNFQNATVGFNTFTPHDGRMKEFHARLDLPLTPDSEGYQLSFYFGPNKFSLLKAYQLNLERLVPLGGWIIGWINRWIVIPTFDTLGKFINSYGLIILLLTVLIKLIVSPLTYKSYLSSAKIRLLKPEIDKLNEKYPKPEDALKKQQAQMALYKSAGANPMGGCLPQLIQLPIWIAMFRFFPASIELRGESFLWADDLSSYDSIFSLPFDIPFYGDHVSLFTLLMAISMYFSSKINMSQTPAGPQMAGMKFMMLYMMPVMMLLWFNNYSSGLTYYFLVSNIFTLLQMYAFRFIVNEDKLHNRMKENTKKPQKKSKFQERYEQAMKQQQAIQAQKAKGKK